MVTVSDVVMVTGCDVVMVTVCDVVMVTVAFYIAGHSATQCLNRWKQINPYLKKGKWSMEEDAVSCHLPPLSLQ